MSDTLFVQTLQKVTDAFLTNDADTLVALYALPMIMETRKGTYVLEDETALRADLELYFKILDINRVTDIIRELRDVRLLDDDTLQGTYRTHMMAGANRIVDPYISIMELRHLDGRWRVKKITNAIGHSDWT